MFEYAYAFTPEARMSVRVATRYMERLAAKRTITIHRGQMDITVEGDVRGDTVRITTSIDEDGGKVTLSVKEKEQAIERLKDPGQDETGR